MPAPSSDDARHLVQAVWDLFAQLGDWPRVGQVANRLDRQHDLAFEDALPHVPAALLYGVYPGRMPSDDEKIGLTLAGATRAEGSAEDLRLAVAAVRLAADLQRGWEPPLASPDQELSFSAADLTRHALLPAAGGAASLARVGVLLRTDNWGWKSASYGASPEVWSFSLDRRVRRYRGVADVADFCARSQLASQPVRGGTLETATTDQLEGPAGPAEDPTEFRSSVIKRSVFLARGFHAGS